MKLRLAALVLLFAASCGGGGPVEHAAHTGGEDHAPITFGEAGDPDEADRTIEVEAVDNLKFEPAALEVEAGETVTFSVTNTGKTDHEFVLGDDLYQDSHGAGMPMEHEEGNGVFLEPGDTGEVTWTFSDPGELIYACHVNGHFDSGMFGRIEIR